MSASKRGRTSTLSFSRNDMDFGHKTFWHYLQKQQIEIENLLENVEQRAYELLLAAKNASWVLDDRQSTTDEAAEECGAYDEEPLTKALSKSVSSSTVQPTEEDVEDPLDVAIREKKEEIWEKIWTRLARYCSPTRSKYHDERDAVIWSCICRAVYRDPMLMITAQNYRDVKSLVTDVSLDLLTVEKLWTAIKDLSVDDVRAAIDDVLHPDRESSDYVVVFGTRLHKELSGNSFPLHGWGHMTAIFPCYSCVRRVCQTVDDIVALTRYALLSGSGLAQSYTKYDFNYDGWRTLALCGFIPNNIEDVGERYTIEKSNSWYGRKAPQWTETRTNNAICVGLSLNDPKSQLFVDACLRQEDLMVLCRKGPNGNIIRSEKRLVGAERRTADTRAGLKKTPWDQADAVFFQDSVLEEARPLLYAGKFLDDCYQIAIVDDGEGDVQDFISKLAKLWYEAYEVDDFRDLLAEIGHQFLDDEELEVDDNPRPNEIPILPNTELDVLVSYKKLWGRIPREGRLADDEVQLEVIPL
ncbi:hypothetical protein CPC08DRAFT_307163 [Agrocybe pediades]|nr:hypothetical protein CPC08DRAFT_307163 [Agrocybe pediades]